MQNEYLDANYFRNRYLRQKPKPQPKEPAPAPAPEISKEVPPAVDKSVAQGPPEQEVAEPTKMELLFQRITELETRMKTSAPQDSLTPTVEAKKKAATAPAKIEFAFNDDGLFS